MRLIDADRLLSDRMKKMYYHLPNGDTAIPLIDIEHAPTVEERKPMQLDNDHIWNELSKVYNMDAVPDEAKSIIGDVMLGLGGTKEAE